MGSDKGSIELGGVTLAERGAALLRAVTDLAIEVGPGFTALHAIQEDPPGQGPLAAIVAGRNALVERGLSRSASCIVLACDIPLLTPTILGTLSASPRTNALLPIIDNMFQPLCARWSGSDLDAAERRLAAGERSLRDLPDRSTAQLLTEESFGNDAFRLRDADTPEELATLLERGREGS